ncbi:Chaperone of endosialidase [Chryseobacterium wanjuense]|uniref:Chaperone of endosialidase n=1 Tax=Chryseobacterium wanjuense TaxID=356305 RepID=A0A1I0P9R5_9FLAO|nr:tail fiber domain-containing protein [Chryseobacterium wanjuense]SEW10981.1 Chaperone of endosialidase [Chryseobacterium wanjuense]
MKNTLFTLVAITFSSLAYSQIGINTPNPQGVFHIDGAKDNPVTGVPSATQQANDITVLNSGFVGIGTTLPKQKLHITELNTTSGILNSFVSGIALTGIGYGFDGSGPGFYLENTNAPVGQRLLKLNYSLNSTEPVLNFQGVSDDAGSVGAQMLSITRSGKLGINSVNNPQNNLTVNGNASVGNAYTNVVAPINGAVIQGNVGIGTAAPNSKLDLGTSLGTNETDFAGKKLAVYNNAGGTDFYGLGISSGLLQFHAASTAAEAPSMVLTSGGNVGIGTNSPSQKLHVIGNILASGTITPSDIRIKKDITDNVYGLKQILTLRTINYKYKNEELGKDKKIGFIAQEVKATMPELIITANDEMNTLGVNYAEITVVLTKAIQEQQKEIEFLKKEIEILKKAK